MFYVVTESVSSSQYFSTSELNSPMQQQKSASLPTPDTNKQNLEERLSISSSENDRDSESLSTSEPGSIPNQDIQVQSQGKEIFEGKKSFFLDETSDGSLATRSRSKVLTKKISLPTFNSSVSIDDNINGTFEVATSTQVWTFGKNSYGQLGHGDLEDRWNLRYIIFFHFAEYFE